MIKIPCQECNGPVRLVKYTARVSYGMYAISVRGCVRSICRRCGEEGFSLHLNEKRYDRALYQLVKKLHGKAMAKKVLALEHYDDEGRYKSPAIQG